MLQSSVKTAAWTAVACAALTGMAARGQILFNTGVDTSVSTTPEQSAAGDFDGDGDIDLAVTATGPDRIHLLFNAGDGTFPTSDDISLPASSSPKGIFAADVDGDGDRDLIVTLKDMDQIKVALNQGGGSFVVAATYDVGASPEYVTAAKLDANSSLDIAVSNRAGNSVAVLLNDGTGNYGSPLFYAAGNNPRALVAADLDQDGDSDLVVASHDTQDLRILLNDGSGIFSAGQSLNMASIKPEGVDAGDVDGDGDIDVVSGGESNGSNFLSVFLQTTAGVFSGPFDYDTNGADPSNVVLGDFDLDTDLDAAIVDTTSNDVAVLPNNADGTFGTAINLGSDTGPDHVIAVDLDANGSQELVTTNEAGDSISVFINQNHSAFTDLDHALAGFNGLPFLEGVGTLKADTTAALRLSNARSNAQAFLVFGATRIDAPFAGGIFVPFPDVILPVVTDSTGGLFLQGTWPSGVNPGEDFFFQFWILDSSGPNNFSASNALQATAQ